MSEQTDILIWFYEENESQELEPKKAYEEYQEYSDYEGKLKTFRNLLGKLAEKGLLERPQRGVYRLSEHGLLKANYILNKGLDDLP